MNSTSLDDIQQATPQMLVGSILLVAGTAVAISLVIYVVLRIALAFDRDDRGDSDSGGGVGFAGLLTILFIGLKLGGVITWSWLWVLSPLWIVALIVLAALAVLVVIDR